MTGPNRIVTSSMLGMTLPDVDRWSDRVIVVLGQNPGPFTGPGTNTFIVGTGDRRILLDAGQGVPKHIDLVALALDELAGGAVIEMIALTHAHPDHMGGLDAVRKRFRPASVLKKPWPAWDKGAQFTAIDDGAELRVEGATLRAVATPGHASDHLCYYLVEEKAVFTGDVVLGAGTTVIPRDGDLGDYLGSLQRLLELDLEVIYPAHGPAIRDPYGKINEYLEHRALRESQIVEGLVAGLTTAEDLVRRIYTDVPEWLHAAARVSVEAHLRKLAKDKRVASDGDDWSLID
jgi:glyoxylase-like metal-dependent hydrolase (beta-lactamase superfamily II)